MPTDRLDLSRSPIPIPDQFRDVPYNAERIPGTVGELTLGANCQRYAYALLRHFGFEIPDLRSSDLWDDAEHTAITDDMAPFDLVLVNRTPASWGAHVGLCVGDGLVLHLSRAIGVPALETLLEMQAREDHRHRIGFKRVLRRAAGA